MGSHALLQGIFPTQGLNLGLLHCRQIHYHLSHQGTQVLYTRLRKNLHNCLLDITAQVSRVFVFLFPEAGCSDVECHAINIPLESGSSDMLQFWLWVTHSNLQVQGLWLRARSAEPVKHGCRTPLVNSKGAWPSKTLEDVTPALTFSLTRKQGHPRFRNIISCLKEAEITMKPWPVSLSPERFVVGVEPTSRVSAAQRWKAREGQRPLSSQ